MLCNKFVKILTFGYKIVQQNEKKNQFKNTTRFQKDYTQRMGGKQIFNSQHGKID